ncbi:MAG: glycosyltransferase [Verrucomicrobia bacterium]|nr:glycosyltransferase [Verrucomicrobiota bacterium]
MKILILMESEKLSGPAKNLLQTLRLLDGKAEFILATFVRGGQESIPFIEQAEAMGFSVRVLRERFRYDPSCIGQLYKLIREERPDILQIHNTKSRLYAFVLQSSVAFIRAIPAVCFFHGETWIDRKQLFYNRLDRFLFRMAKHVVVVVESQVDLLAGWGVARNSITVLHNAIRIKDVAPKTVPQGKKVLLSVGRHSQEKGHLILIKAIEKVVRSGQQDFVLKLVGEGPDTPALRQYVHDNSLGEWVSFEGYQDDPERYYRVADLFLLPSLSEGMPNVLLEAGLFRLPMISFAVGGIPNIFTDGEEIFLLEEKNETVLSEAIQSYLNEPGPFLQRAERARQRVERDYNMEAKAGKLLRYYQSLVPGGID